MMEFIFTKRSLRLVAQIKSKVLNNGFYVYQTLI